MDIAVRFLRDFSAFSAFSFCRSAEILSDRGEFRP